MSKSKVCLILSAFIYGFAPILAKFAYKSGANGITLTFLRTFLMLPLLFFIMIFRKVSFKLTKKELIDIILLGVVGGSFSMISLYAAYDYISTGTDYQAAAFVCNVHKNLSSFSRLRIFICDVIYIRIVFYIRKMLIYRRFDIYFF